MYFCKRLRLAIIVPIAKPGKNYADPHNYRPISLTSGFCKLYEKLVNNRLVEYLEDNKPLTNIQFGFRKNLSTIDHLVRFDTYVRKGRASERSVVAVMFDFEKAYDLAWRYGILRDLYEVGLRGRLPMFVDKFLERRYFRVRVSTEMSAIKKQRIGVPQGSTLSVTLFAVKINSLAQVIPVDVFASLFVDDLLIAYTRDRLEGIERKL